MLICSFTLIEKGNNLSNFGLFLGEDAQVGERIQKIGSGNTSNLVYPKYTDSASSLLSHLGKIIATSPPPPAYFTGYTLRPGNPCENFTLPPPPADKKKTGPRRKFGFRIIYTYVVPISLFLDIMVFSCC